jgi:hypothetical protein
MDVKVEVKYRIDLNRDEWLLVSRALRGLLTPNDEASARALQEQMLVQKHNILSQMAEEADKAVGNVAKAKGGRREP